MTVTMETRSERVDLRMTRSAKQTLQRAATVANKTLTEFLLDKGMEAAYEALADRRMFVLDEDQWNEFVARLDAPPAENAKLRALLARKPAWEA